MEPILAQDWQTIRSKYTSTFLPVIAQHRERAVVLAGVKVAEVHVDIISGHTQVSLALDASPDLQRQTWNQSRAITWAGTAIHQTYMIRREIGRTTDFLEDYLRWRILSTATVDWSMTFRILVTPRA